MPLELNLETVEKLSGGRVHLTAASRPTGGVRTLCGITFGEGRFRSSASAPDCRVCLRRRDDKSFLSTALFDSGRGADLLQMSLAQIPAGRPRLRVIEGAPSPAPRTRAAAARQRAPAQPERPHVRPRFGDLVTAGFRRIQETVFVAGDGTSVELDAGGRLARLRSDHPVELIREEDRVRVRTGSVLVEIDRDGVLVTQVHPPRD